MSWQTLTITPATDARKSTPVLIDNRTKGLALYVPTIDNSSVNLEVYVGPFSYNKNQLTAAEAAATNDTGWVPLSAALLSAGPGGVVYLMDNAEVLGNCWVRVVTTDADQTAARAFKINYAH